VGVGVGDGELGAAVAGCGVGVTEADVAGGGVVFDSDEGGLDVEVLVEGDESVELCVVSA